METYISLLLLVVPGFIAKNIYEKLNHDTKTRSDFENILIALIYSMFILTLNYFSLNVFCGFNLIRISDIETKFNSIGFIIGYAFLSIIMSIIVAGFHNFLKEDIERHINNLRKKEGKTELTSTETVWSEIFIDGEKHAILVEKDGNEYAKGFIELTSPSDGQEKELYLVREDVINNNHNLFDIFKGVYIDFDKNIKIKEYSLDKFNKEIEKRKQENKIS